MMVSGNYTKTLAVVHGASEYILCDSIKSNLRIPMIICAENKGRESIQINGIANYMSTGSFRSHLKLSRVYPKLQYSKGKIQRITIFTIMDTDDCQEHTFTEYKNKELFFNSPFCENIVPIYNSPNLDNVMTELGFPIDKNNKRKSYEKCFPGKNGDIKTAQQLLKLCEKNPNTNLEHFIRYCIENAPTNYSQ